MPLDADDIRREMSWTCAGMTVPMDAEKREEAVGYLLGESVELWVTVAARHWDQFTNGAAR
jgi:hypothetical protein